jgi:hypothetical protein
MNPSLLFAFLGEFGELGGQKGLRFSKLGGLP